MPLVTFDNVEKSYGGHRLFATVSFSIDARDHAVLVGRNGSGKTTLLRLIAGDEHPDSGTIARTRGRRIWLHEQTPELERDRLVVDYLMEPFAEVRDAEERLRRAEERLAGLSEDSPHLRDALREYQQLQRRFEMLGGYHPKIELDEVLAGLGLPPGLLDRSLFSLSGGELTRVTLARALIAEADLLLLDEPTNHLDIDSVEWLEEFLSAYEKAFVLVTHDRRLLEKVGSRVLAVEDDHVQGLATDFATYVKERDLALEALERQYEHAQEKIEQLQRFYDRFHAKKNKAKQAQAKLTQMERIKRETVKPPRRRRRFRLGLPQPRPSSRVVLEMRAPAVSVGDTGEQPTVLLRSVDVVVERGEKVALLGPNGAGKTTLAETIVGVRPLAEGGAHLGYNVRAAYYSQQGRELDPEQTMLQTVLPLVGHDEENARAMLGRFLFTADEVEKKVLQLSGGERSRLRLLVMLAGDANFLLLDEPTNHLDIDSVEALAAALGEYTGTIMFITHDRHLIDTVADRVLEIRDRRLLNHLSPGRYWEAREQRLPERGEPDRLEPAGDDGRQDGAAGAGGRRREGVAGNMAGGAGLGAVRRAGAGGAAAVEDGGGARPLTQEEARRLRARLRGLEAEILKLERRLGDIDADLAEPETYADRGAAQRLADERATIERRLEELYPQWEETVDRLR